MVGFHVSICLYDESDGYLNFDSNIRRSIYLDFVVWLIKFTFLNAKRGFSL